MLIALLILGVGLTPTLFSAWVLRRADQRLQQRLRLAMETAANYGVRGLYYREPDRNYIEGTGYVIGDISCQFNAHSAYLRCAINPLGPCQDCSHYQSREF
ncbi:MAG: hypothetical protein F6K19_17580 [Cyanothece sp. SIO1E1]|nr:hypothetical protein [Cyanothece sp. SIO1E1]